jgi:hypothetical protein
MDYLQRAKRADLGAGSAAGAVCFHREVRIDQLEGALRADRNTASAISTDIPMYFEH